MSTDEVLRLYEEKFKRLESSKLIQQFKTVGWKFGWDMEKEQPSQQSRMPDLELIEAYILNLRFFRQDNEPISWAEMSNLYKNECQVLDHVETFEGIRSRFNSELDRELWFRINGEPITYREVFLGMIYSQFAHANQKDKHPLFKGLKKESFTFHFSLDAFIRCIDLSHRCLALVHELNKAAFANNKAFNADTSGAGAG